MASKTNLLAFPRLAARLVADGAADQNAPPTVQRPVVTTREVTIASGLHSGGTFAIQDGDLIVVGTDVSCDICLSDAGIAPRHAAIALHGSDVLIRSLDGDVSINGDPVRGAKRLSPDKSTVIALGSSEVQLEMVASSAPRAKANPTPAISAPTVKKRIIFLSAFSLFAVVSTLLVAGKLNASLSPKPDTAAVQALPVVKKEELIEQVRESFRMQGYDANVTHIDGARVQVDNLDEVNERVRHAAERVRTDVPQLEALVFLSPKDAAPPTDPPPYGNRAGDRIVTRIDGKTAYLVAGAGTRYFTGSKLPSGHTIRRITREAVQVERDGQIDWFRF